MLRDCRRSSSHRNTFETGGKEPEMIEAWAGWALVGRAVSRAVPGRKMHC